MDYSADDDGVARVFIDLGLCWRDFFVLAALAVLGDGYLYETVSQSVGPGAG